MASFSTKLQILGTFLSQGKKFPKLLKFTSHNVTNIVSSNDPRSFWSWRRANMEKSKIDCRPRTYREKIPDRPQPCNPKCGSKCLQISKCADKEMAKKKLSNCREPETKKKPYMEMLFGWRSKSKNLPNPNSCWNAHQERAITRKNDPRLCDSRYKATAGDVLLFTECPKEQICKPREPSPKSPPSYKLPRAVMTLRFIEQAGKSHNCAATMEFEASCANNSPKCSGPKASILPFEELRPPGTQRKMFSCKDGIRPEDVLKPLRRGGSCGSSKSNDCNQQEVVNSSADLKLEGTDSTEFSLNISGTKGKSRIEQLKKLTRASEGSRCCDFFTRSTSIKPPSCPRSCKMSTFTNFQDNPSWSNR